MKVIVIGPTELTRCCIDEIAKHCKIQAVYTLEKSQAFKKSRHAFFIDQAEKYNFDLVETKDIKTNIDQIKSYSPDLIIEAGWSQIIPKEILTIPKKGTIGLHGAILPDIKGGASLNWALIRGESEWGVTLYYLAEKVDDGDIMGIEKFKIDIRDDIETTHKKSDYASTILLKKYLPKIKNGTAPRIKQFGRSVFLPQRKPTDGIINWDQDTLTIYNWIRAQTHPFPGSFTMLNNMKIYVWKAEHKNYNSNKSSPTGTVLEVIDGGGILVKTQNGSIKLTRLQLQDEVEMWADEFVKKYKIKMGDKFEKHN